MLCYLLKNVRILSGFSYTCGLYIFLCLSIRINFEEQKCFGVSLNYLNIRYEKRIVKNNKYHNKVS